MHHLIFEEASSYETAILIKYPALKKEALEEYYVNPSNRPNNSFIAFSLKMNDKGKSTASMRKEYLNSLLKALESLKVKYLYVCDGDYFKTLTGCSKADPHYGYVLDCVIKDFENFKIILGMNHQRLFYNPDLQEKITFSIQTLDNIGSGIYINPGSNIIHKAIYPKGYNEIENALNNLLDFPEIFCDIETFSLKLTKAGIGTIGFSVDKHRGIAFPVDVIYENPRTKSFKEGNYLTKAYDNISRDLLRKFFTKYSGKITYHNGSYDIKILIYELFMDHALDYTGLLNGIEIMTKNINDTKLIAYLAKNSTARIKLSLKELAQEFAGNYAQDDIKDICRIPMEKLLEYNLVDCLSTAYVKEKNYQQMIDDNQKDIYDNLLLKMLKNLLQIELTGMPIDINRVLSLGEQLKAKRKNILKKIFSYKIVLDFEKILRREEHIKANLKLKVKVKAIEEFNHITFNPASDIQLRKFLYDILEFEATDFTDKGAPSTSNKALKRLKLKATSNEQIDLINLFTDLTDVNIILNNFIKNFIAHSVLKKDGHYYLHGGYNIGGTVSCRLSSSDPNMQQTPSTGTVYAKPIKECFVPPSGWLLMGADFASLEDRISALTTKDPNKLKVYTDGYDGHCLRAYYYFQDQMKGIVDTVTSINSIKTKYPELRQESKAPTFLLTYGGKYYGLMTEVGLTEEKAKSIEANYHEMYSVSDAWVADKLEKASQDGYITVAFGLKVRTPILKQTYLKKNSTPREAESEGRTAGNALGQSYGLLNSRAGVEFQERTLASPYKTMIRPIAQIHDSLYFLVKDNIDCVKWFNDNLIECMEWQELPEIQHPTVKLGGTVEIYYPSWAHPHEIPNKATKEQIKQIAIDIKKKII